MKIKLKLQPKADYIELDRTEPVILEDLVKEYEDKLPYKILMAKVNCRKKGLDYCVDEDAQIEFLDMRHYSAYVAYQNTITFIYIKAVRDVFGDVTVEVDNSLNKGFFTIINTPEEVTEEQIEAVSERMRKIIESDIPIIKSYHSKEEAIEKCRENGLPVKKKIIEECSGIDRFKFYTMDGYSDFFFGNMTPSTGYVDLFELRKYAEGVLLRFPYHTAPEKLPEYVDDKKIHIAFREAKKWQELLGIIYLPDLNRKIKEGKTKDLILLSEALHEKKIAEIADMITKGKKRIVLIAGPSSSGKTTTAKRLITQLRVNGLDPMYMGTDDYFLDRKDTPRDEEGKYNYEGLDALDVDLFNNNMNALLAGKTVDLPEFDFIYGVKVFGKRLTSINDNQPIIIEGIHALNDELTKFIPDDKKFKIYISPFTQLNIDTHNRIPTTDARKLRRMVRDYNHRGKSAATTIDEWTKVRAGEDENIFPYNSGADVVFNTALVYELAVLKKYAEPILHAVKSEEKEYDEAQRLLKFLNFFDVIDDESAIPCNSIIREFIGGSVFE